jgi:hypothetical protein
MDSHHEERLLGTAVLAEPSIFASIYVSSNLRRSCAARQCPAFRHCPAISQNMGGTIALPAAHADIRGRRCRQQQLERGAICQLLWLRCTQS